MLVFRFENVEGAGVYQGLSYSLSKLCNVGEDEYWELFNSDNHPTPRMDGIPWETIEKDWYYGFKDFDQAMSWFGERQRNLLAKIGVTLNLYETKGDFYCGNSQMVFDKCKADKVLSIGLKEHEHALLLKKRIRECCFTI